MIMIIYNTITLFKEEDIESTDAVFDCDINDSSLKNITRYQNCDILINQNDIEKYGFDKDKIIQLAIQNDCPVVVKSGESGKWYFSFAGSFRLLKERTNPYFQ